jgi:hypothetical protein
MTPVQPRPNQTVIVAPNHPGYINPTAPQQYIPPQQQAARAEAQGRNAASAAPQVVNGMTRSSSGTLVEQRAVRVGDREETHADSSLIGCNQLTPLQQVNPANGKFLSEIISQLSPEKFQLYRHRPQFADEHEDLIVTAHECTHGINSRVREMLPMGYNAFYTLNNRVYVFRVPKFRMMDVANWWPQELRGESFKLYLVDQHAAWGDNPTYPLDEWVAYINGVTVAKEMIKNGHGDRIEQAQYHKDIRHALELTCYATYNEQFVSLQRMRKNTQVLSLPSMLLAFHWNAPNNSKLLMDGILLAEK